MRFPIVRFQIPICDNLLVRISPKVAVGNLFRMLETAYNLRSFLLFHGKSKSRASRIFMSGSSPFSRGACSTARASVRAFNERAYS